MNFSINISILLYIFFTLFLSISVSAHKEKDDHKKNRQFNEFPAGPFLVDGHGGIFMVDENQSNLNTKSFLPITAPFAQNGKVIKSIRSYNRWIGPQKPTHGSVVTGLYDDTDELYYYPYPNAEGWDQFYWTATDSSGNEHNYTINVYIEPGITMSPYFLLVERILGRWEDQNRTRIDRRDN